ncbi:MAG: hypothetical protein ACLSTO_00015 [Bilophila wadsworthia]
MLEELYGLYLGVYAQSEIHFDLLTRDFFAGLLQSREIGGVVFCYRHDGNSWATTSALNTAGCSSTSTSGCATRRHGSSTSIS